ncbi:diphosphomevalonate/mevalonate 3,5-bisphosphate decarboxylase family protein [Robertkochia solimangrovi]|uniref:diphosphomevalonate/mevalonate 3,5-bisphosphate decarboxylase family protein n=1 Tax=Robertkochia solimangrovi TaxID=2213046 RepID=UPI00117CDB91|nr:diphosphomevalonate decarboxylase [Robertkochia solimangrovi]TRZ43289.1 diphosphomevalonate decarboxylase [Robertkochia solimangrovi]
MTVNDFLPSVYEKQVTSGSVTWRSPSNIALVKYWGKHGQQLPMNPSVSFTLSECATTTKLSWQPKDSEGFSFDLFFEGEKKIAFYGKIEKFLERVQPYLGFLEDFHFKIETSNSFPHSSGIASSASGMSALSLALMSLEEELTGVIDKREFKRKASFLSRLGSGSACRSIDGPLIEWGEHVTIPGSSDLFGVPYPHPVAEVFTTYRDVILLVDKGVKKVSSTVGHNLMSGHPYAEARFDQARNNMDLLQTIFQSGDLSAFTALVESEALSLHAVMLASTPSYILMKPNTLQVIEKVWEYRKETGSALCFTLDAGANVHLLFPDEENDRVMEFIKSDLVGYCQNGQYICDGVGKGAEMLK